MELRGNRYDVEKAASQWSNYGLVELESNVVSHVDGNGALARWTFFGVLSLVLLRGQDTAFPAINDGSSAGMIRRSRDDSGSKSLNLLI